MIENKRQLRGLPVFMWSLELFETAGSMYDALLYIGFDMDTGMMEDGSAVVV